MWHSTYTHTHTHTERTQSSEFEAKAEDTVTSRTFQALVPKSVKIFYYLNKLLILYTTTPLT